MKNIDHIGIAVKDLNLSIPLFERLLKTPCYKTEMVESERVNTAFFQTGESKIELVQSETADGVISKFIEKKGEGIHHIAYAVDDLDSEINRLTSEGFQFISKQPKDGADNKRICFLHPKSTNGILVELCEEKTK